MNKLLNLTTAVLFVAIMAVLTYNYFIPFSRPKWLGFIAVIALAWLLGKFASRYIEIRAKKSLWD